MCGAVAGDDGYIRARFRVQHLQCPVIRRQDRTPPVQTPATSPKAISPFVVTFTTPGHLPPNLGLTS
jgi:hypothetical protein